MRRGLLTVVTAIVDFNRRRRLARIAERFGTFRGFLSQEELRSLRDHHDLALLHRDGHFDQLAQTKDDDEAP